MASTPELPEPYQEEDPTASRSWSGRRSPRNSGFLFRRIGAVLAGREGGVTTAAAVGAILAFGLFIEFFAQTFQALAAIIGRPLFAPTVTLLFAGFIFLVSYETLRRSQRQDSYTRIHHVIKILPPFDGRRRADDLWCGTVEAAAGCLTTDSVSWGPQDYAWCKGAGGDEETAFRKLVEESNLHVIDTAWRHFLAKHGPRDQDDRLVPASGSSWANATVTLLVNETVARAANWTAYRSAVERVLKEAACRFEVRLPINADEVDKTRDAVSDVIREQKTRSRKKERILVDVTSGKPHQRIAATHAAVLHNVHVGLETGFNEPERRWHHLPFNM